MNLGPQENLETPDSNSPSTVTLTKRSSVLENTSILIPWAVTKTKESDVIFLISWRTCCKNLLSEWELVSNVPFKYSSV